MAVARDEVSAGQEILAKAGPVLRDVPAVTRAVAILRALARAKTPMGVVALAKEIGAIPSTCLHILRILVNEGLASFDINSKKYTLGPGVLSLATAFTQRNQFVQVVRPHLDELSRAHRCAFAAIEQSDPERLVVVAVGDVNPGLTVRVTAGTRLPILMSGSGRVFAAFGDYTSAELKRKFGKLRWDDPPNFETWLAEVQDTRVSGYSLDWGNYMRGVAVIAVPVFGEDSLLGCITTVDFREQMTDDRLKQIVSDMQSAATQVSWQLGYHSSAIERRVSEHPYNLGAGGH